MKYRFYVEFLRNKDPFAIIAILIRFSIKRKYNHVEIVAVPEDPKFPTLYYGAVSPHFRVATKAVVRKKYEVVERFPIKISNGISDILFLKLLDSQVGTPYSYMSYLWLLPMACWSWLKREWSHAAVDGNKAMNCCEAVARPLFYAGYDFRTSFDAVEFEDIKVALLSQKID